MAVVPFCSSLLRLLVNSPVPGEHIWSRELVSQIGSFHYHNLSYETSISLHYRSRNNISQFSLDNLLTGINLSPKS